MKMIQILLISLCFSCSIFDSKKPTLSNIYKTVINETKIVKSKEDFKQITFSARQMSIKDFAVWFSDTYSIGFIYSENLSIKKIDLELKDASIIEVVNSVARFLNTDVIQLDNSYFVGEQKASDNGVLVKKVRGVSVEDLKLIMESVTNQEGSKSASVTSDGVVFLIDKEQNLRPVLRALESLEQDYKTAWVVQLYMFDLETEQVQNLGIDLSASGNVAYRLLKPDLLGLDGDLQNVLLEGLIDFSKGSDYVQLVSSPLFVMRDGKEFSFSNLNSFPYVQSITTQEGFIEQGEVSFIDSGMDLKVTLREMLKGSLLNLTFVNSKVLAIDPNSQLPILNSVTVQSEVPLHSSGVYLLCQSDYSEQRFNSSFSHKNQTQIKSQLQIYAKVFKLDRQFKGMRELQAKNFPE